MSSIILETRIEVFQKPQYDTGHLLDHTLDASHVPRWMKEDGNYIIRGYRPETKSIQECFNSLWFVHNETVNIWSHLIIGILFLLMITWSASPTLHGGYTFAVSDIGAVQCYLVGNALCLLFSAIYHSVSCHSKHVAKACLKLDYLGIVLSISTTSISATYFGLHNHKCLALIYISFISICGSMTFWSVLNPNMDGPKAAPLRAASFIMLGASGVAPIIHSIVSDQMSVTNYPLFYLITSTTLYLLGAGFYVLRIPEKYWRGTFDIWGASHQIFHVLVNIGQVLHLIGLIQILVKVSVN